ncbi:MAG: hypothetical protein JWN02_1267 [Acidobacteria bacterium]|nr:hypothetical protein [Acidobacteriota bacterium]
MGEVTIHFRGACTHFRGIVPGVPHRVVLVDGMGVRFQLINWPDGPTNEPYEISPHLPIVVERTAAPAPNGASNGPAGTTYRWRLLSAPGAIDYSIVYAGARLKIANVATSVLTYDPLFFEGSVPHLKDFVHRYEYSSSVVYGGRAACYFDINTGTISPENIGSDDAPAWHTKVLIETDGDPVLRVTPFTVDFHETEHAVQAWPTDITLSDGSDLYVNNLGLGCRGAGPDLDFMLHYLTAQAGIPERVTQPPFGSSKDLTSPLVIDVENFVERMRELLCHGFPTPSQSLADQLLLMDLGTAASCSDAQYP